MNGDFDALFAHLAGQGDGHVTENDLRSLVFCDFGDPKSDARNYEEVRDVEQLRHVVENYLDEFNSSSKKPMDLVLFRSATETNRPIATTVTIVACQLHWHVAIVTVAVFVYCTDRQQLSIMINTTMQQQIKLQGVAKKDSSTKTSVSLKRRNVFVRNFQ